MRVFETVLEVVFTLSLVLLGKFDYEVSQNAMKTSYQVVVTVFWVVGVLRFGLIKNDFKDFISEATKSVVIAIAVIPLWYIFSGQIVVEVFEPMSVLIHVMVLLVILKISKDSEKLSGRVAYYTHAVIPVLVFILVKFGVAVEFSIIITILLLEPINFYCYYNKNRHT